MNTIIENYKDECGNSFVKLTDDNRKLGSVMASLARNNTFFPNIVNIRTDMVDVCERDKNGDKVKDENGKNIKHKQKQLTVRFADDTWVTLKLNPADNDDLMTGILYAISKRLFGEMTPSGYVNGSQFMNKLKKLADNAQSDEKDAEGKRRKAEEKAKKDEADHKAALERKENHPSLRQCVDMLYHLLKVKQGL